MSHTRSIGHFPFLVPHSTGAEPGPYEFALGWTLEEAMSRYWRVRTWRVSMTMSGSVSGNTAPEGMGHGIGCQISGATGTILVSAGTTVLGGGTGPLASESSLVAITGVGPFHIESATSSHGEVTLTPPLADGTSDGGGRPFFTLFCDQGSDPYMAYDPLTKKFQPYTFLTGIMQGYRYPPGASPGYGFIVYANTNEPVSEGGPYVTVDATVTFDGRVSTRPAYVQTYYIYDFTAEGFDIQLKVEPYRYWEYQGTITDAATGAVYTNVPLYDAVTGEPAVSPITGAPFTLDEIKAFSKPEN